MSKNKVVRLQGEGGGVFEYELPLNEQHADMLATGKLRPADADALNALKKDDSVPGDGQGEPPPVAGKGSGIEAWQEYAASLHIDTDGMDRDQIIEAVNQHRAHV